MIGWNLNMRYGIKAGALIRGLCLYIVATFACFGIVIHKVVYSIDIGGFDCSILAILILIYNTFIVTLGIKSSNVFNKILTTIKLVCLVLIIIVGLTKFDSSNFNPIFIEANGFNGTL